MPIGIYFQCFVPDSQQWKIAVLTTNTDSIHMKYLIFLQTTKNYYGSEEAKGNFVAMKIDKHHM
jgi:hypothetical protein